MDLSMGIARASMQMAQQKVATAVETAMMKNVMDLQKDSMAQLLATMGLGGSLDIQA